MSLYIHSLTFIRAVLTDIINTSMAQIKVIYNSNEDYLEEEKQVLLSLPSIL